MADEKTVVEGIEYSLFKNDLGAAVRVLDLDSGEVVSTSQFKTEAKAGEVYDEAVRVAKLTH